MRLILLLFILATFTFVAPSGLAAQLTVGIEGTVTDLGSGAPIQGAVVSLSGGSSALTGGDGAYRIDGLQPGQYTLRVQAIGYSAYEHAVTIEGALTLDVRLEEDAVLLDPVEARLRRVTIRGTVEDTILDLALVDAQVRTSLGHDLQTNSSGRFRLRDIYEDYPVRLEVRAFGYLPFHDVITPTAGGEYRFALREDPLVTRWVAEQSARLAERASPRFVVGLPNLDRAEMLKYAGSHTLYDVLIFEYGPRKLNRVGCVVIDEGVPLPTGAEAAAILQGMVPEELQRVEFMFDGGMMRIYTRDFLRDMVARPTDLRQPSFFQPFGGPPLCR